MAVRINPSSSTLIPKSADHRIATRDPQTNAALIHKVPELGKRRHWKFTVRCSEKQAQSSLRTCKICKAKFDPLLNHRRACRYHPAHFGGIFFKAHSFPYSLLG
ncbi:unnamed protein product [Cuscuta campestris]|uniref:Uncharacterized protein n=1 Tax=Cuscuta campestris TaxID=132261 RepID=A0A484NKW8_9ASTE|nr:unnamed protein product [Cuscuta campestris]